jgi:hypothetical protein
MWGYILLVKLRVLDWPYFNALWVALQRMLQ